MKQMAMRTKFMVMAGTALVAVLALSGVAWAATALAVTKTVPSGGATGVARAVNVKAYFNHDMKASTVTSSTFKIRKQGTTTWLGATRSVNNTISPTSSNGGSQSVATLNPNADLASNTTYQVVVVGGSSGVKDLNGMTLGSKKRWTFTTARDTPSDTTPPNTTIDTKPANPSNNASPSFTFSGTDNVTPSANLTFECKLDSGSFAACTSPKALSNLAEGSHTFSVTAKDAAGNVDATPDSYTWTVDAVSGVTATPNPLDLSIDSAHGDVLFCQRSERLTVTNNGPGDVTFEDVNITGTDAKYFSSGSQSALAGPLFFTVLDGNHFFDEVTFTAGPTAAERNSSTVYSATLTYKDGSGATIGNPVSLTAQAHCLNFGG
jgi:hypothetical protein